MDTRSLEKRKTFREQTAGMTPQEKREHIWHYYKVAILGGAFALFMIISMTVGAIRNHYALQKVQLMVLQAASTQAEALWEEETVITTTPYLAAANQGSTGATINMMVAARIAANELDVAIIPKDHVQWIHAQEATVPLETVLTLPENAECIVDEATGEIVAVSVVNTPFYGQVDAANDYVDQLYLCVMARNERLPAAVDFAQKVVDTIAP
jgi:hypothetical protein